MRLFLLLAISVCAFAQTKPKLQDVTPPPAVAPTIVGFVNDATGKPRFLNVRVDSSLLITIVPPGTTDAVLSARPTGTITPPVKQVEAVTIAAAGQTVILSIACNPAWHVDVLKNGVDMEETVDYTLSGAALSFTSGQGIAPGDRVKVRCYR